MAAYRQLLAENHVEEILQDVKQNKNLSRKKELPVWLPLAASFNNGTRKAEDAVPSGLYFLDIDEKGLTEQLWKKVHDENLIEAFRIVYFAESAGGGTHIWAWRTPGLSIEEDIQRLASRLGVGYDSHVTDLARCCFMVSERYVKFLDETIFEASPSQASPSQASPSQASPSPSEGGDVWLPNEAVNDAGDMDVESPVSILTSPPSEGLGEAWLGEAFSGTFHGIPYAQIVQALLWKLGYGDAPAEGERNTALYTMCRYLRFICDFDEQKLFAILPHWGLSGHEVRLLGLHGPDEHRHTLIDKDHRMGRVQQMHLTEIHHYRRSCRED
jgi:hypothetical protein